MLKVGIFFGSSTNNTKNVAYFIYEKINKYFNVNILNISKSSIKDFSYFDILILGTSTWYCGEIQYDWDIFLNDYNKKYFLNKIFCFFGCGNQEDYGDYFCDGVSKLYEKVNKNKSLILGYWPTKYYSFNKSKSLLNKDYFIGLMIDEMYQSKLTQERINSWVSKLLVDFFNLNFLNNYK